MLLKIKLLNINIYNSTIRLEIIILINIIISIINSPTNKILFYYLRMTSILSYMYVVHR